MTELISPRSVSGERVGPSDLRLEVSRWRVILSGRFENRRSALLIISMNEDIRDIAITGGCAHWAFCHILRWPIDGLGTLEG